MNLQKKVEQKMLEMDFFKIIKKTLRVIFDEPAKALGYTNGEKREIHIAWEHEEYCGLDKEHVQYMRRGVGVHELLHQLLTNFKYCEKTLQTVPVWEAQILMTFINILEDPAIEYQAPDVLPGELVDALNYSIYTIYEKSPEISLYTDPFSQYVNALIQFGDMGLVKGEFTFKEAGDMFKKTAPLFNEGIICPDGRMRIDIAKEIFEISRPLWQSQTEEIQEFTKELAQALEDAGIGNGSGMPLQSNESNGAKSERAKRRQTAAEKMSNSGNESSDSQSDGESSDPQTGGAGNESSDSQSNGAGDESSDSQASGTEKSSDPQVSRSGNEPSCSQASSSNNKEERKDNPAKNKNNGSRSKSDDTNNVCQTKEEAEKTAQKERKNIEGKIKTYDNRKKEAMIVEQNEQSKKDFGSGYDIVPASSGDIEKYTRLCAKVGGEINKFAKKLKQIFENDTDEATPFTVGKYNVMRGASATTAKIFDKKRLPTNVSNMKVMVVVDQSGSMRGERIQQAREATAVIVEACNKNKIPCYVMGFESSQHHFLSWKYNRTQSSTIAAMSAMGGTADANAIRTATKILQKKKTLYSYLFVISDGEGQSDLKQAVKDARKIADVFAIGIGDINVEYFKNVYGQNFLHIDTANGLANKLGNKLIKLVKNK